MRNQTMRTPIIYLSLLVLLVLLGGMFLWLHQNALSPKTAENKGSDFKRGTGYDKLQANGESPPIPVGLTLDDIQQKSVEEYGKGDAKLEAEIAAEWKHLTEEFPITENNRAEIEQMLSKFHPIADKSEAEIIQILMSFFPEDKRLDTDAYLILFQNLTETHTPLEKEKNVFILVHTAQMELAGMRETKEKVERDVELKQRDPDAYYIAKIKETRAEIPETEKLIREAEARGDLESVEDHREHLAHLHEWVDILQRDWDFAVRDRPGSKWQQEIDERVQQQLLEWEQNPPEWLKPYQQAKADVDKFLAEFEKELASMESERGKSIVPSVSPVSSSGDVESSSAVTEGVAPSQPSAVSTFDPVRSVASAYAAFRPFRVDLDKKYFDVVVSQYMSPKELDTYFPTEAERQQLQRRTAELQKSVVSKVREVVSGVKGATPAQRRQLARELVSANYEKSFAESVLKALEQDAD